MICIIIIIINVFIDIENEVFDKGIFLCYEEGWIWSEDISLI